ncbi:ATP-binding cassette domain-containing protein [Candidatus Viadribacter manganicus]|uniref:ABC transporter ATP-binding protein n=1 Tax=Candidatus Viadribacter manganicus TaxID=1759059 RepID=A0A1B1ADW8_9PROT|nr:ATP-binding cassette domain-containing protein [Candidatus Viadribacter manganicus]ANP44741.1 ABC transporter ATP-binding protein [Candidatus Viadribacter manganicus]
MASLELRGVGKAYGRKRVLQDISLTFEPGLTLLVGPSGAGKSTLLRLIATAERPNKGAILWNGKSGPGSLRATLGYAPQAVDLPEDLTAREFAMHIASLKGLSLSAADKQFGAITDAIGLHADINNRIASFSGGMRRRLIFAQALLGDPQVLALDEPTAELDGETARRLSALIVERAKTAIVVVTTHLADELAPFARATLRVENGNVAATASSRAMEGVR